MRKAGSKDTHTQGHREGREKLALHIARGCRQGCAALVKGRPNAWLRSGVGGGGSWGVTVGKGRLRLLPTNSTSPTLFWTFEDTRWADISTAWSQKDFLAEENSGTPRGMLVSLPSI